MKALRITQRDLIRGVANKWRDQYDPSGEGRWNTYGVDKRAVYEKLRALDLETCSPADVADAIGNPSWTHLKCNACETETTTVVMVGEAPDYESHTTSLCYRCALAAFAAFDCTDHEDCCAYPTTLGRACVALESESNATPEATEK